MSVGQEEQLIIRMEAALLEYVERYGLTEQARILLDSAPVYHASKDTMSASTNLVETTDLI